MSMFTKFRRINYTIDNIPQKVTDITVAFLSRRKYIDDTFMYQKYFVQDTEIPESVSKKIYNTPKYYWVILFINNIVDPLTEWVMDQKTLELYALEKHRLPEDQEWEQEWGFEIFNRDGEYHPALIRIHHFYDAAIKRVCDDVQDKELRRLLEEDRLNFPSEIVPITNLQHEIEENEKKRNIIIINPAAISKFEADYNRVIESKT